jgi:hypothetical protein
VVYSRLLKPGVRLSRQRLRAVCAQRCGCSIGRCQLPAQRGHPLAALMSPNRRGMWRLAPTRTLATRDDTGIPVSRSGRRYAAPTSPLAAPLAAAHLTPVLEATRRDWCACNVSTGDCSRLGLADRRRVQPLRAVRALAPADRTPVALTDRLDAPVAAPALPSHLTRVRATIQAGATQRFDRTTFSAHPCATCNPLRPSARAAVAFSCPGRAIDRARCGRMAGDGLAQRFECQHTAQQQHAVEAYMIGLRSGRMPCARASVGTRLVARGKERDTERQLRRHTGADSTACAQMAIQRAEWHNRSDLIAASALPVTGGTIRSRNIPYGSGGRCGRCAVCQSERRTAQTPAYLRRQEGCAQRVVHGDPGGHAAPSGQARLLSAPVSSWQAAQGRHRRCDAQAADYSRRNIASAKALGSGCAYERPLTSNTVTPRLAATIR